MDHTSLHKTKIRLVAGTGHCGTGWFAMAFAFPEHGICCYHETSHSFFSTGKLQPVVGHATLALRRRILDLLLESEDFRDMPSYRRLWEEIQTSGFLSVCLTNDFSPEVLCTIHPILKDINAETMLLFRNGINVVQSIMLRNNTSFWYNDFITRFHGPYTLRNVRNDVKKLSFFDAVCVYWSSNALVTKKMTSLPRFRAVSLESLTNDPSVFRCTLRRLGGDFPLDEDQIKQRQGTSVGKKNYGEREPAAIWDKWPRFRKSSFRRYCAEAMDYLGYQIPD